MEYIKQSDLDAIKSIIDEFEGETILGKHMFKAIKAYFKQKDRETMVVYTPNEKTPTTSYSQVTHKSKIDEMIEEADKALKKYNLKLRKQRGKNGKTKIQKTN